MFIQTPIIYLFVIIFIYITLDRVSYHCFRLFFHQLSYHFFYKSYSLIFPLWFTWLIEFIFVNIIMKVKDASLSIFKHNIGILLNRGYIIKWWTNGMQRVYKSRRWIFFKVNYSTSSINLSYMAPIIHLKKSLV